jgi:hypothetical protein
LLPLLENVVFMLAFMIKISVIMDNGKKCPHSEHTSCLKQESDWVYFDQVTTYVSNLTKVSSVYFDKPN